MHQHLQRERGLTNRGSRAYHNEISTLNLDVFVQLGKPGAQIVDRFVQGRVKIRVSLRRRNCPVVARLGQCLADLDRALLAICDILSGRDRFQQSLRGCYGPAPLGGVHDNLCIAAPVAAVRYRLRRPQQDLPVLPAQLRRKCHVIYRLAIKKVPAHGTV